jgi:hypothetical protein
MRSNVDTSLNETSHPHPLESSQLVKTLSPYQQKSPKKYVEKYRDLAAIERALINDNLD